MERAEKLSTHVTALLFGLLRRTGGQTASNHTGTPRVRA